MESGSTPRFSKVNLEIAKYNAIKEVIKSLTTQLKEMAGVVLSGYPSSSSAASVVGDKSNNLSSVSTIRTATAENDSNGQLIPLLPNGTKFFNELAEWVLQDEPGVNLTLSLLP